MADSRKQYEVEINGVKHTMLLDPEDAKNLYGDNAKAASASNKQASAQNKGA